MTIEQRGLETAGARFARRDNSPRWSWVSWPLAMSVGMLWGCGEHDEPPGMTKQAVAFDEVPEPLRAAARKALPPGVKLNEAWKNLDGQGTLHSYEIRGRNAADGKIREVRVSLTGQILESE